MKSLTLEQVVFYGYRVVSRKFCHVSRIDTPNWGNVICKNLGAKKENFFKENLKFCYNNHYRRVYSKDILTVPKEWIKSIPKSNGDFTGYIPKPGEK